MHLKIHSPLCRVDELLGKPKLWMIFLMNDINYVQFGFVILVRFFENNQSHKYDWNEIVKTTEYIMVSKGIDLTIPLWLYYFRFKYV